MSVIDFRPFSTQEQADDVLLQSLFDRQCRVSVLIVAMAKQLYAARSLWIGGGTIPWDELTSPRKAAYMTEVEHLIKSVKGEVNGR
jgi:hypothetical protein